MGRRFSGAAAFTAADLSEIIQYFQKIYKPAFCLFQLIDITVIYLSNEIDRLQKSVTG
jgi:hypothetical protein